MCMYVTGRHTRALQSLMALTNLASLDYNTKRVIVQNGGIFQMELLQMDDHPLIRRAATEVSQM